MSHQINETSNLKDTYYLTGDVLGEGSYGRVETCINMFTDIEYAVKLINKSDWCFSRAKVLKEVEIYYLCSGHPNIIQVGLQIPKLSDLPVMSILTCGRQV